MPPDKQAGAPSIDLGKGTDHDELLQRANEFEKAYREADASQKRELKKEFKDVAVDLIKKRAAAVRADPESHPDLAERMDMLNEAFGGSEAIQSIMASVVESSSSADGEIVEDKADPTGSFRHVLLRKGEWARELTLAGVGPAKMVIMTDTRGA